MSLVDRIMDRKQLLGLTSDELATRAGVPVGTINKLLSSQTSDPRISTVRAIARALGCSIDYLAGLTDAPLPGLPANDDNRSRAWLLARFCEADATETEYYRKIVEAVDSAKI